MASCSISHMNILTFSGILAFQILLKEDTESQDCVHLTINLMQPHYKDHLCDLSIHNPQVSITSKRYLFTIYYIENHKHLDHSDLIIFNHFNFLYIEGHPGWALYLQSVHLGYAWLAWKWCWEKLEFSSYYVQSYAKWMANAPRAWQRICLKGLCGEYLYTELHKWQHINSWSKSIHLTNIIRQEYVLNTHKI
jgi:hypothetical protein